MYIVMEVVGSSLSFNPFSVPFCEVTQKGSVRELTRCMPSMPNPTTALKGLPELQEGQSWRIAVTSVERLK